MNNPYAPDTSNVLFEICEVTRSAPSKNGRDTAAPVPNYSRSILTFPPAGEVSIKKQANYEEKTNKTSGAVTVEDRKYDKPVEITIPFELLTDEENGVTALAQKQVIEAVCDARDSYGRRMLFAPVYPLLADSGVDFIYFVSMDIKDTEDFDVIQVNLTFRQWIYVPPKVKKGGKSTGAGVTGNGNTLTTGSPNPFTEDDGLMGTPDLTDIRRRMIEETRANDYLKRKAEGGGLFF